MTEIVVDGPFRMAACAGVPAGLSAYAHPTRSDGTFATDSKGRPKVTKVHVQATDLPLQPARPAGAVSDKDWRWMVSGPRKWATVVDRLGSTDAAWEACCALARAGCGSLEHRYVSGVLQQPPRWWIPHQDLKAEQHAYSHQLSQTRDAIAAEAAGLSERLADSWPGVAASLRASVGASQLLWLVRAARDLDAGERHDGVRAFVQAHHPDDDKAREDLPSLLRQSGWEPEAIRELGVDRNPYIGVGGPILAHHGQRTIDWAGWPGPHDLRLPHGVDIRLSCPTLPETLVIIENRQAAETICDQYPGVPVIWCRGHHSDRVLDLIGQVARECPQTLICTDADLGGLRIAARLYRRTSSYSATSIVDIGNQPHRPGRQFTAPTLAKITEYETLEGPVGIFASAIRSRGYTLTQEALVRSALQTRLSNPSEE